jgi:hypothetical protein
MLLWLGPPALRLDSAVAGRRLEGGLLLPPSRGVARRLDMVGWRVAGHVSVSSCLAAVDKKRET